MSKRIFSFRGAIGSIGTFTLLIGGIIFIFTVRYQIFNQSWFYRSHPIAQGFYATLFTWFITALGAATVFIFRDIKRKTYNLMLGFSAGVMIAASYWSLLAPGIELSKELNDPFWIPPVVGFLAGGFFLWGVDQILPHLHRNLEVAHAEGVKTSWQRTTLLVSAMTLHNIPEGLAVGVAFGAAGLGLENYNINYAIALALGIGIQNFPEGMAVSVPLRREGKSLWSCFSIGQLSGIVEPIAGIFGAWLVFFMRPLLPYALCFAAGAMIYVVVEELIPEAQSGNDTDSATIGTMLGFTLMMLLDISL
ncbi:MAG: ZIP family metal transporter [Brevinema sp.]